MVITGRSVHLTTFFPDKLEQVVNQYFMHMLSLVTDNNPSWMIYSAEGLTFYILMGFSNKDEIDQGHM